MSLPLTAGGLRSSQTACRYGEGPKSRSTRRWSAPSSATGVRDPGPMRGQRWHFQQAKTRKLRRYPELQPGGHGRCRLVVFGLEVGGRFDSQALALLRRLARARARDRAPWAREAAGAALTRRWTALAALAALRAHAQSLLELPVRPCDASQRRRRAAAGRAPCGAAVVV